MPDNNRIAEIFQLCLGLRIEERDEFLRRECGSDETLLNKLRALLRADAATVDREPRADAATVARDWEKPTLENMVNAGAAPEVAVGETIGPYRLEGVIGSGGMGTVYRAVRADAQYEKSVAIKRIRGGVDIGLVASRFRSERQILANLEHANIARLLDGGVDSHGLPYLVMEYVDGVAPQRYSAQHKPSLRQQLELFRQICAAVHYAHQHMVIHRDLKPGNILVTEDGTPKLLDFGIAKVLARDPSSAVAPGAETAMYMMTPQYASPEQILGQTLSTATDIYSLGVILYELLTDHSPYRNPERPPHELMVAICEEEPIRPSTWRRELRGELDNIVLKALRRAPGERYASADEFSSDLERYLDGRPVLARGDAITYLAMKLVRRHKIAFGAALVVVLTLIAGLVAVTRERNRAERRFEEVRKLAHSVVFDYHDAIQHLPGSTPVRARMVKDALEYLDSLAKDADTVDLQRELVTAYVRVGNVQGNSYTDNLGDTVGALASARKAIGTAESLLARDDSPSTQLAAAEAFALRGSLAVSSGDLNAAKPLLLRARELNQKVYQQQPELDSALSLMSTLRHLGDLYGGSGMQNLGQSGESVALYQQANAISKTFLAKAPGDARLLKDSRETLFSLSSAETGLGRTGEAQRDLREGLRLSEEIAEKEPENTLEQLELANASLRFGLLLMDQRRTSEAIPYCSRAAKILEKLTKADPNNALYRRDLSVTENQLAAALRASGNLDGALAHNRRSLDLAEALAASDPKSAEYRSDVGISRRKLAETLILAGDGRAALQQASAAADVLCEIAKDSPDAYLQSHCGRALLVMAEANIVAGNIKAALNAALRSEEIAAKQAAADPANTVLTSDQARAEVGLGAAYRKLNQAGQARSHYQLAAALFSGLRKQNALTAEDSQRADLAAKALATLPAGSH